MSFLSSTKVKVATCNLNQWSLDFDLNLANIIKSIHIAKEAGAKFRVGPELEISGYSCEDHFLELDTFFHSEQSLATILSGDYTNGILCQIGCPLMHNNVRYNCQVFCLDKKIILVRPKMFLADDGNYRERRYFSSWKPTHGLQDFVLSDTLRNATGQISVPIGFAIIATKETKLAAEVCEELWTPNSPHIQLFMNGVEIISNASGSHHQLRKLDARVNLIQSATGKCGGIYVYSNLRGNDGGRLYFDGCSLVSVNGELVAQASQFSLRNVEVITAIVDLNDVREYRQGVNSLQEQFSAAVSIPTIDLRHFQLATVDTLTPVSKPIKLREYTPPEECAMGPACWLWDYLRRSGAGGYMLPLSGGADSASVATIVFVMCNMAVQAAQEGDSDVLTEIKRHMATLTPAVEATKTSDTKVISKRKADAITSDTNGSSNSSEIPSAQKLCEAVLHTVYLGTSNSSAATRNRAGDLSKSIGAYHVSFNFDSVVSAVLEVFARITGGKLPRYESQGGSPSEDIALQNIQARLRMVLTYLCAQLFPWVRGRKGFLLVLGSGNVDESLRGYMTKYDCSSADINPIGGICKGDLKNMMLWASSQYSLPALDSIVYAVPTVSVSIVFVLFVIVVVLCYASFLCCKGFLTYKTLCINMIICRRSYDLSRMARRTTTHRRTKRIWACHTLSSGSLEHSERYVIISVLLENIYIVFRFRCISYNHTIILQ